MHTKCFPRHASYHFLCWALITYRFDSSAILVFWLTEPLQSNYVMINHLRVLIYGFSLLGNEISRIEFEMDMLLDGRFWQEL